MAVRRVQLRRGNTAENNAFTGAVGEVTVDTQTNSIRVHDNDQAGGFDLMRADMSNNASITSNIGVTGSIIIGPALGANTITLGQATSTISIPGTLNVNIQNTTQDLAVQDRAIILASGNEGNPHTDGDSGDILSLGLIFTRTLAAGGGAQDEAVFFWDEEEDRFKLGINAIDGNSTEWNTGLTTAGLLLGSLDVDNGNITNVGNIALDTISAATDGNTIGMTLKQAGGATAFTIVDDDAQGANTFLTINATDGSDSVTIDATSFVVNSTISLDNSVVINDSGADKDFRVEGSTEANLLFVDASADSIGIGKNNPSKTLDVTGTVGISSTLDVAGKSTLTGSLDLTTASSNGITFRSEIAENGADADATLLRVNIGGTDGGGNPNYKAVSWDADTDRFTFDTNAQILNGGLVLGDGTNATTISVPDQTAGNTAGENLTISAGVGAGTGAGGSLIFQTGADNAGALSTVLTLDKDNKATFTGNIDFSNGTVLGGSVGNGHTLNLGGHVGSTTNVAGILQVTSNTIKSSGATAITLSSDDVTVEGDLSITGASSQKVNLGATNDGTAFEIAMQPRVAGGANDLAGANLTITAGQSVGNANGGSLIFRTSEKDSAGVGGAGNGLNALQTVLTLDTAKLATFTGNIDFSDGTVLGGSVGDTHTLTLGGHTGSTTTIAGKLKLGANSIQASDGGNTISINPANDLVTFLTNIKLGGNVIVSSNDDNTITLDEDDATVLGGLTITGTGIAPSAAGLGGAGQLVIGAGVGADSHLTATHSIAGGANDLASGNFIISAGKSVGQGAGGSIVFQTSESDSAGVGGAGNGLNDLQTVLTLDNAKLATFAGNIVVEGREIKLGTATGGATKIEVEGQTAANTAGHDLTISAGVGKGSGAGGSIVFQTAPAGVADAGQGTLADALEIFHDKRSYFSGNIDFSNGTVLGGSVGDTHTLNLGGHVGSTTNVAGILQVTGNTIKSSGATAITLSSDDATVVGGLTITGTGIAPSGAGLGGAGQLVIGAGGGADSHLTAAHSPTDGANDIASGNFIISAGKSVGNGAGGSIVFQTSESGAGNQTANALQTVLTLDKDKLATFTGNIKLGTDVIVSSNGDNTITLSEDDVTVLGDLNITGASSQKVNLGAEDESNAFEIVVQKRTGGGVEADNKAGADLTISAGASTGKGTGGSIFFKTPRFNSDNIANNRDLNNNVENPLDTVLELDENKLASFAGAVTIAGNLTVNGTTTTIDSTISTYVDPMILLNKDDLADTDIGVFMGREATDGHNVAMYWDHEESSFAFASTSADASGLGGAVNLSAAAAYALQPVKALSIGMGTTDTTASNTIQTRNANAFVVKDNTDGANTGNNLVVNTASGQIETLKIVPINHNTHDIGADDNRFVTGYFASLDTTSNVQFDGTVSLGTDADNQDKDITVVARTGADKTGNDLTITAGQSTGTGAGGSLLFKTSETGGASNADANALQTVLTLDTDNLATFGDAIKIGGNSIQNSSGTEAIALSANNATTTISATTTKTSGDLTVEGRDVVLGTAGGGDTTISVPTSAGAGHALTISSGLGNNAGVNDGSLILRSGSTAVLTLDTNELATFAGNIKVGTNVIQSSGGQSTITLSNKDATVLGGLTITGEDITPSAGGLGGAGQLVIGAGAGADSHLTATHSIGGGANDIASGNFIISAGKSVGNGAGGSIVFQTSTSGAGNGVVNALQTVLTLDKDLLATFAGDITVTGNTIKSSVGDAIQFTGTNTATKGDLTVEGRDVVLGTAGGGATTISVPQSGADSAGHNLTISAGQGNGAGRDGGILAFQTGGADGAAVANALSLGADKKATFAGAIDVASTSILRGNTSLYSGADLFVYSDAGTTEKFSVDGATGNTSIAGTLGVTGITTLDDTLKIKTSPTGSVGILFNSDTADADITLLKVNDTTANVQLDWDDSESSFVVKGGKIHSETDFSVGGTITTNPNFKVDSSGNVTIKGTLSTTSASGHVSFRDRILALATNSASATNDIGFYGLYKNDNVNEVEYYTGLIYHPIDTVGNNGKLGVWKLFHSESVGVDAVNVDIEDTNLGVLDISELRGGSALGNNDTAGADLTITGGKSTGSATGGGIVFKTGGSGAGAAVENTPALALTLDNAKKATFEGEVEVDRGGSKYSVVTVKASEGSRYECASPAFAGNAVTISAPDAVENKHAYFLSNGATAGTVNLFDLTAGYDGYVLQIFNTGTNTLTVDGSGAQEVDGALTKDVVQGASLTLMAYGTAWYVV